MNQISLKKDDFLKISKLIEKIAGIHLPENEKNFSLITSRLAKILRLKGYASYTDLIDALIDKSSDHPDWSEFISSLTTNTTSFFREEAHFDIVRNFLRDLKSSGNLRTELRIWCAAASTGMEVYTILMVILETFQEIGTKVDIKFVASDIDIQCLKKSSAGVYREEDLANVSNYLKTKYFNKSKQGVTHSYQVKSEYRAMIKFARVNLISFPYPFKNKFDLIFCRNVLIYFTRDKCQQVTTVMGELLSNRGLLVLGHSETGMIDKTKFENFKSSTYIPKRGKAA